MSSESWATSPGTRRSMQGNRGRDTKPELAVRRILHARGRRYRTNYRPLAGLNRTADIAFTRTKLAVFIDGCYWHGCTTHYSAPRANGQFWADKVARNRRRDEDTNASLEGAGWSVLRFWTHENPTDIADVIEARLDQVSGDVSPGE